MPVHTRSKTQASNNASTDVEDSVSLPKNGKDKGSKGKQEKLRRNTSEKSQNSMRARNNSQSKQTTSDQKTTTDDFKPLLSGNSEVAYRKEDTFQKIQQFLKANQKFFKANEKNLPNDMTKTFKELVESWSKKKKEDAWKVPTQKLSDIYTKKYVQCSNSLSEVNEECITIVYNLLAHLSNYNLGANTYQVDVQKDLIILDC